MLYYHVLISYSKAQVLTLPVSETISPGMWLCYRTNLYLDKLPSTVDLQIAADSKYWLWVNGDLQVREGGLKRGPNPQDTYCDELHDVNGFHQGKCSCSSSMVFR